MIQPVPVEIDPRPTEKNRDPSKGRRAKNLPPGAHYFNNEKLISTITRLTWLQFIGCGKFTLSMLIHVAVSNEITFIKWNHNLVPAWNLDALQNIVVFRTNSTTPNIRKTAQFVIPGKDESDMGGGNGQLGMVGGRPGLHSESLYSVLFGFKKGKLANMLELN
jgi:hypothetical protein